MRRSDCLFLTPFLLAAALGCNADRSTATDAAMAGNGGRGGGGGAAGGSGGATASRIFVTSAKYTGALNGLTGGDAKCQALADAASLGGRWLAWLGDGVDGPATRFVHSDAPYNLVGGAVVARSWPDLIDGTIEVPINHDERGAALPASDDMIVWTAVFHTGGNPTPVNCMGWTDASDSLVPTGLASATDTGWTVTAPYYCSEMHRLYCFEQ
jgi:hypothetical protein